MKKIILFILILAISFGVYLKWEDLSGYFHSDTLVITLNTATSELSPYGLDLNNATRIANIYEGLIGLDKNLNVVPALAVSWGNINETTWEFRLREGVNFHDGMPFKAQDVLDAFEAAKASDNPQIKTYIDSIKEIKLADNGRIEVYTYSPDPLLLSKLSKLYIYKENNIGTGPYRVSEWTPEGELILEAFPDYWGVIPTIKTVHYNVEKGWVEREDAFLTKKTDILGAVPPELATELPAEQLKTKYGLEVNFLMFKLDDPIFKKKEIREALQKLINPKKIVAIGNGFIRPASQFVAQGVFGFNQEIKAYDYKEEAEPRDLFGVQLERTQLDYLATYRTLAEYLASQFQKAGFSVKTIAHEPKELLALMRENNSPLYLIGWQAENGDAGAFFDAFIHSKGTFNEGRYSNTELDTLIEKARQEMNPQKRLILLKEIGSKVHDELIGIPLFETSRLYAVQKNIQWEPRLDGMILGAEATK